VVAGLLTGCNTQEKDRELAEQLNNEWVEHLQKQNFENATKLFKSSVEADYTYTEPHAYLIQIYLNQADFDAALAESEIVIEKSPEEAENWVLAGILTEKKGNKELAFSYYKESIKWFQKRLEEQKENLDPEIDHELPLQDEINIIFSHLLLENEEKSNALIAELEDRFPNNAMIQNLYDFDKAMYLESLFPEME
jgi:tetratricopeptide (TPR) repeat protein